MGWMAGKEHSSGPVIQTHSPIFFGFLLVPTLSQRPFTDGKQRHPGVRLHRLGNSLQSPLKSFPLLSEAWTLPRLSPYKSRLRHEPSHSEPLRSP
ncbi:hypothetical protein NPIL_268411 [Nephila pilipes]|uniref:Uncharacterized protein n=1 Tax=Nephila pilipes TaxID=299642 RepID=A0A8X6NJQ5_NEPPI|nr:hypothetical protein NPIL_268411 [Nephila pilipes]